MIKKIVAVALLVVSSGFLAFALIFDDTGDAANRDFISYWAAGQLLTRHANPYDAQSVFAIQKLAGFRDHQALVMRNPPVALLLALPLGFVNPKIGAVIWTLLIVCAITASIRILWSLHGRPNNRLHLIGYAFAPALACLLAGQATAFVLLGLVLFLKMNESRPITAGACLAMLAVKPHLFFPFAAVILLWSIDRRKYRVLLGLGIALLVAMGIALFLNPSVMGDYRAMLASSEIADEFIPTLSLFFRLAVNRAWLWVQFVPAALGVVWAAWYYLRNKECWSWQTHGSLVLLVSVLVVPYAWFLDEIVLLPAILQGIYISEKHGRSLTAFGLIAVPALVEVLFKIPPNSGLYIWTGIAWITWYFYATRVRTPNPQMVFLKQ